MKVSASAIFAGLGIALASMLAGGAVALVTGWPIAPVAAIAASAGLVAVAIRARAIAMTASITVATSLGMPLALATKVAVRLPLATTTYGAVDIALKGFPVYALLAAALGAILAIPIALVARRIRGAMLPLAVTSALVVAVLATFGLRSLARPSPDDFAQLMSTSILEPGGHAEIGRLVLDYHPTPREGRCVVHASGHDVDFHALACPTLTVRSDAPTGLVVLYAARFPEHEPEPVAIITSAGTTPRAIVTSDFAGRLGAPHGWVLGALLSLVIACLAISDAFASRARKIRGVDARHEGGGWVRGAGAPRFVAELATAEPGPVVVVLENARAAPTTYRDDGAAKIFNVKAGTLAALLDEQRTRVASWACVAIVSLAVGSIPLWVARLHGLL